MSKQDLHGRVSIITGGSTETAGAVALALAHEGARVCLCGRQADLLELAAGRIRAAGGTCLTVRSELDSLEAAESVLEQTSQGLGRPEILILVSPFWSGGQTHSHSVRTWDLVL